MPSLTFEKSALKSFMTMNGQYLSLTCHTKDSHTILAVVLLQKEMNGVFKSSCTKEYNRKWLMPNGKSIGMVVTFIDAALSFSSADCRRGHDESSSHSLSNKQRQVMTPRRLFRGILFFDSFSC